MYPWVKSRSRGIKNFIILNIKSITLRGSFVKSLYHLHMWKKLIYSQNDRNRCFCHHLIWNIFFHAGEQKAINCRGYRWKGSYILESIEYKMSEVCSQNTFCFIHLNTKLSCIGLGYKPHCLMVYIFTLLLR